MFSSLRQDSLFYILDKRTLPLITLKTGRVSAVSNPVPKYSPNTNPFTPLANGVDTTVDITVMVDGQNVEFKKVPSNLTIYGENGVIISESKDAISSEIEATRESSKKRVEGYDNDKKIIEQCDIIYAQLHPSIAQEKERETKLNALETRMDSIESVLSEMNKTLKDLAS